MKLGALEYKNRRGDVYYLQQCKTRTGKPKYYVGKKLTGEPVAALPEGHELYERPDTGIVVFRKIRPSLITELERAQAEAIVRRASGLSHAIVAIEDDALVVYTPSVTGAEIDSLMSMAGGAFFSLASARVREVREEQIKRSLFTQMLRFTLVNPDTREYRAERWCFRGRIDNWIYLPGHGSLPALVEEYAQHLDRESFFELM